MAKGGERKDGRLEVPTQIGRTTEITEWAMSYMRTERPLTIGAERPLTIGAIIIQN